jgi:hypothetical protein
MSRDHDGTATVRIKNMPEPLARCVKLHDDADGKPLWVVPDHVSAVYAEDGTTKVWLTNGGYFTVAELPEDVVLSLWGYFA